ncbi:MAG: hypothetical protein EOO77_14670 [Oxalobacteraceae bacterium]|nr:MAG: hypothetical protein EOO77_14670 [Oxalobacteraceae bacterium]
MTLILDTIGIVIGWGLPILLMYLALRSLLSDVWKLALITELPLRRVPLFVLFVLWAVAVAWGAAKLLSLARFGAVVFVVFATVPALAWLSLRWWAWLRDDAETRREALEIAIERADRLGEPAPTAVQKRPWKDYVFDAEVARRRALYEPPPI